MIDLHAHLAGMEENGKDISPEGQKELDLRRETGILTCFCGETPAQWELLKKIANRDHVLLSFGIHPWYADRYEVQSWRQEWSFCSILGEIGLDSVWCEVPLKLQEKQFQNQLQIAADLKKPVLLHTKGQEKRIGEMIKDFPGKVCVHWYSGEEKDLEPFLLKDCYFTLGPDTALLCGKGDAARKRLLKEAPGTRLFLETDGIGAVAWAFGKEKMELSRLPVVLKENLECAAFQKGLTPDQMERQMEENLREFLKS